MASNLCSSQMTDPDGPVSPSRMPMSRAHALECWRAPSRLGFSRADLRHVEVGKLKRLRHELRSRLRLISRRARWAEPLELAYGQRRKSDPALSSVGTTECPGENALTPPLPALRNPASRDQRVLEVRAGRRRAGPVVAATLGQPGGVGGGLGAAAHARAS